ncbi:hypothetical protein TNCV_2012891 [Trichonephila clavipes]|uniref:Uncharacterized protein n=1 Tax=Trichonephila clavipes TaxID=2585209 RepID=A0A8X6V2Z5_TRICX|nr:hypothetical protein TNCV_2012891 [Trichonephila clavipes]
MDPIDAFPDHISTTVVPVTLLEKPVVFEYAMLLGRAKSELASSTKNPTQNVFFLFYKDHWHQKRRGWTISNEQSWRQIMLINLESTNYLPPPTPAHVPAEKRHLEEKSLPFSKRRFKVRITSDIRRVSRRPENALESAQVQTCVCTCADSRADSTVNCADFTVACADFTVTCADFTVTCADFSVTCPRTCADSRTTCPRTYSGARHFVADPHGCASSLDQLMSFLFGEEPEPPAHTQEPSCFTRSFEWVVPRLTKIGRHISLKIKGLTFGSHALNASGGHVRDMVGRLGNASRREPYYGVSQTLETGFGKTCGTLALESFGT